MWRLLENSQFDMDNIHAIPLAKKNVTPLYLLIFFYFLVNNTEIPNFFETHNFVLCKYAPVHYPNELHIILFLTK